MNNENKFPQNKSDLPLNKQDGSEDTFTDESLSQQAQTVQPTKADKTPVQTVKIVAGILIVLALLLLALCLPILVLIITGSSGLSSEMLRLVEVSAIFQLIIGMLLLVTSVLLLRKSEFGRKLVILTAISMFVAEIVLISQGSSLFYWIFLLRPWFVSLSLLFFLCIFSIRSVTSKDVKSLFAKPQQMVTAKAQSINEAFIPPGTQVSVTTQKESDDSQIPYNLKIIGFISIAIGFMSLLYMAYKSNLVYLFYGVELSFTMAELVVGIVTAVSGIGLFVGGIGLVKFKNWGRMTLSISGVLFILLLAKYVYETFLGWILLSFLYTRAIEIVAGLGFIVLLVLILRYVSGKKVKRVCN